MTKKEYILDSLIDDDKAFTQILEYFEFVSVDISEEELNLLLNEMINEGLTFHTHSHVAGKTISQWHWQLQKWNGKVKEVAGTIARWIWWNFRRF